jgi:hypothetical protein
MICRPGRQFINNDVPPAACGIRVCENGRHASTTAAAATGGRTVLTSGHVIDGATKASWRSVRTRSTVVSGATRKIWNRTVSVRPSINNITRASRRLTAKAYWSEESWGTTTGCRAWSCAGTGPSVFRLASSVEIPVCPWIWDQKLDDRGSYFMSQPRSPSTAPTAAAAVWGVLAKKSGGAAAAAHGNVVSGGRNDPVVYMAPHLRVPILAFP